MSDMFKLFISSSAKTKKDIQKEIQRLIRAKIENVVDNAIREFTQEGEKIPPKDSVDYRKKKADDLTADELAYAPVTPDEELPIVEKIREMRKLGQSFHHGYMMRQCAEVSIVRQGEFMQDVTDDFNRSVFCGTERPIYGALSLEQLRTYFTWRTDVRRGVYGKTDKSYVILYCYELLNKIGVLSSQDAFDRLIAMWENCRSFCPYLDGIMPSWLKDFYAFNHIDGDFSEHEATFPVKCERANDAVARFRTGDYSTNLEYLMGCSSYNLRGSIFFSDDTLPMLEKAIESVLHALEDYFKLRGISLFELICGRMRIDHLWVPFYAAYVDRDRMDGFHACNISVAERYCLKRGEPSVERFEAAPYRSFIGYILKSVESVLRERTGFRYSIVPNLSMVLDDFTNREKLYSAAKEAEFARLIPETVNEWCDKHGIYPPPKERKKKKKNSFDEDNVPVEYGVPYKEPRKVEIDIESLVRIRKEAEETARKLIVEEYEDALPEEQIEEITAKVIDEVFDERQEEASFEVHSLYDFSALSDEWRGFAETLDAQALELLKAVVDGTAEMLCRERGVLPEMAFEEINAAALENIGDYLIEDGCVIPDYAENISEIVRHMK